MFQVHTKHNLILQKKETLYDCWKNRNTAKIIYVYTKLRQKYCYTDFKWISKYSTHLLIYIMFQWLYVSFIMLSLPLVACLLKISVYKTKVKGFFTYVEIDYQNDYQWQAIYYEAACFRLQKDMIWNQSKKLSFK